MGEEKRRVKRKGGGGCSVSNHTFYAESAGRYLANEFLFRSSNFYGKWCKNVNGKLVGVG